MKSRKREKEKNQKTAYSDAQKFSKNKKRRKGRRLKASEANTKKERENVKESWKVIFSGSGSFFPHIIKSNNRLDI